MISFDSRGDFKNTERFLKNVRDLDIQNKVRNLAEEGVTALANATPVDSGVTAGSWGYEVTIEDGITSIAWTNSQVIAGGVPIVILLQYGHGTGTGGYVRGRNFINPAIQPIFDKIADDVWKAVTSA